MRNYEILEQKKSTEEREQVALNQLMNFLNIHYKEYERDRINEVTYFTCLKVLSEAIAKLPLNLQVVTEKEGIEDMISDPLWETVRVRPNPYMTPSSFWAAIENNRNHYGNSYAHIDRSTDGINLWILDPKNIRIYWDLGKELSDRSFAFKSIHSGI